MNKNPLASIHKLKSALPLITALLFLTTLTAFSQKPEIYVQTGHSGRVNSVAFSPDGKTLASAGGNTIKLWDLATGQEFKTLRGNWGNVSSVAFSPDGKTLASGSDDLTISVWDVATGKELTIFRGNTEKTSSVVFSSDGKLLASRAKGAVRLWDVASGEGIKAFEVKGGGSAGAFAIADSVAFSPDGRTLVSGDGSLVKFWDVRSGNEIRTLTGHSAAVSSIAFSPDGKWLVSGSADKTIKVWDIALGKELRTLVGHSLRVSSLVFGPNGKTLASAGDTVKLWDVSAGLELKTFGKREKPVRVIPGLTIVPTPIFRTVDFSPDGTTLVTTGAWDEIKFWHVTSDQQLKSFESRLLSSYSAVTVSPDRRKIARQGDDTRIKLRDLTNGEDAKNLGNREDSRKTGNRFTPLGFSPDSATLLIGGSHVKLLDATSGKELRTFEGHSGYVHSVAFSSDGLIVATGSQDTIQLWDVGSGRLLKILRSENPDRTSSNYAGFSVEFTSDGKTLVGHLGDTITLWDVVSGQQLRAMKGTSPKFSPAGKMLAGTTADGIKLWDVKSGRELKTFPGNSPQFSPDGKTLLVQNRDNTFKLWAVESGDELANFKGHVFQGYSAPIYSIEFSADGKSLVSGGGDHTIKLWDAASGRELRVFNGHSDSVREVTFSPDGKMLISGSDDSTVRLWDVNDGNELANLIEVSEDDWVLVTPAGRFDGSPDGIKLISYIQENKILPLDSFFEQFFTPNLLQKVYAREPLPAVKANVDFSKRIKLPPVVRITSPKPGSEAGSDTAQITVEANDQGGGVEDIRLYQNGKLLDGVARQLVQDKRANTRTFEVSLLPGVNTFRATAFNSDRTEAVPDEIRIELKAVEASANLYILAVGLNEYKNTRYNLNYGNADAQAFADAVEKRGKNIFKEISKKVMFDADASHIGIKTAFNDIIKKARPQDVFVFFYAGHGAMSEGTAKTAADFYLVPYDVVSIFGDTGNLVAKGIAATDLREMSRKIKALKQLIVIDACQSGGAVETFAMVRGPAEEKAIQQLARSAGVTVLASAGQQQVATEFKKLGHGVFTYTLLKGLNGEADGSPMDGKVTISELKAYLDDQVPELTKLHRGKSQYPNSFTRGQDFPIGIR